MPVSASVNAQLIDPTITRGLKINGASFGALAATFQVLVTHPTVLVLDPNTASRTVLLPAEASSKGLAFFIFSDAGGLEDLVVKEDSDTTTIVTISQNEAGIVWCDGVTWRGFVGGVT